MTVLSPNKKYSMFCSGSAATRHRDLDSKLEALWSHTQKVEQEMKSLEELNDKLDSVEMTWQSQEEQWRNLAATQTVMDDTDFITQTKQPLLLQISGILNLADEIVSSLVTVELPEWKGRQQWACIGSPDNTPLDQLESWFTKVTRLLQQVHRQLMKLQEQNRKYVTDVHPLFVATRKAKEDTCVLLRKLFQSALVVEKQPAARKRQRPLIISTKAKFTATLRFLVNIPEFQDKMAVKPVFDKDVEEMQTLKGFRRFSLIHDSCKILHVNSPCGGLMAEFEEMSLVEIKLRPQGSNKNLRVTEELHIIKFVTNLQYAGLDCNIEVSTLPLVVTCNTNQHSSAWASIMWCTMLDSSEQKNLSLFLTPQTVTWQQLAPVLSWQFLSVGKRALDKNQLTALRNKFVDRHDGLVHWNTFSSTIGSAWIWLEGILDLIEKSLVDLWKDGCIMGFVSKKTTRVLLKESPTGTFLLRFSESNKEGAISISWVDHSNGEPSFHDIDPYTKKELSVMSLVDIIYHYNVTDRMNTSKNPLLYLYPNIQIDAAFGRYRTPPESTASITVDGYVKRKHLLSSVGLTPPPSPPTDPPTMDDTDMDVDLAVGSQDVVQDLFPAVLDVLSPQSPLSVGETSGFEFPYH